MLEANSVVTKGAIRFISDMMGTRQAIVVICAYSGTLEKANTLNLGGTVAKSIQIHN